MDVTIYRRDPETGHVYVFGGLYGCRTIDDRRSAREDFDKMLLRRAGELPQRRRLTISQRLAIEEEVWGYDAMVRRRLPELSRTLTRTRSSIRLQSSTPSLPAHAHRPQDESSPLPPDGVYRKKGVLVALESFEYVDPSTKRKVHIKAGRTHVSSDCHAVNVRPRAFAFAA